MEQELFRESGIPLSGYVVAAYPSFPKLRVGLGWQPSAILVSLTDRLPAHLRISHVGRLYSTQPLLIASLLEAEGRMLLWQTLTTSSLGRRAIYVFFDISLGP